MKVKGIRLSEVEDSLELLKNLCLMHETCSTCWLYDPQENETACLLVKKGPGSLSVIIEDALSFIKMSKDCIMPECPYCPICDYGFVTYPEDTMPGETDINTEWHCTYDLEVKGNEAASVTDSLADSPGTDQADRSGA